MLRQHSTDDRLDATYLRAALERIVRHPSTAVVCTLSDRSLRFRELADEIPSITPDAINVSLRELDRDGLVARRVDPGPPLRVLYELTQAGAMLLPAIGALVNWTKTEP
jgi:DNA-binding HxlR family transcriptional regulator